MKYVSVLFFYLSTFSYFISFLLYLLHLVLGSTKKPQTPIGFDSLGIVAPSVPWTRNLSGVDWGIWATRVLMASVLIATVGVIFRAIELGNASQWTKFFFLPLTTTYETLTFFSWLIPLVYLVIERKCQIRQVGIFISGAAFVLLTVAASPAIAPSPPTGVPASLHSYWLTIHVSFMVTGIAFFTSGFGATLLYLWRRYKTYVFVLFGALLAAIAAIIFFVIPLFATFQFPKMLGAIVFLLGLFASFGSLMYRWHQQKHSDAVAPEDLNKVEEMIYRCIALGFPFYTIGGIVFGGLWAEQAWSRYWGWDPKETSMLVSSLLYAVYLHARLTWGANGPSWRSGLVGWMAVFGYLAVLYAWLGINYFVSSLHSFV